MKNIQHEEVSKTLRSFHNHVKNELLTNAVQNFNEGPVLLDIGVGRGGDMHKWKKLGIKNVIGIDIDKGYISDAKERYNEIKTNETNFLFYVTNINDALNRSIYVIGKHTMTFHIISCQFALHYHFTNMYKLQNLLADISNKLVKGGLFIGTVSEGNEILKLCGHQTYFQNSAIHIHKCFDRSKGIGDLIKFTMAGTLYFGENLVSHEYLVFKDVLIKQCDIKGLKLKMWKCFDEFESPLKQNMDHDHKVASYINYAFMFEKIV